ncbi:hypothetical protein TTHERM_00058600 (macronuclear) [Tetrahymena thermophila SB210]|uniref:Uncharacterized protein n=1 Tax=Tetrahymena thermophila (strain SB210) TaxID=312017 RepID=I7LTV2_TETTS|nr:hypothetical protein TTHERM_00058600 [Tetrahymena thermophila SB210]EAR87348.3 hypothetical protein TTHERM_00058600 [Tetrahymena thermophila SB210]|eukprot:XP_001007593.3 hypothetical protein TTHERM_00058600 [Tetrahymena thermophila SB210]
MQYQRGSPQGQVYDLMHPPGRDVLSSKLNDYQGSHPRNLRNDRNVGQNQFITEQITNDQGHVQRHADMNLKMRNPLFHEFHYKKIIEPQYTMPQKKQEIEQVNSYIKSQDNVDSLDMFQQNYLQRQKNFDRAKQGHNLMNYQLDQQNRLASNNQNNTIQQQSPYNNYAQKNDYPQAENVYQNIRQGSPPPPQQLQQNNYNPQRASAPNIHKIPQNNQINQGPIAPPSRQYQMQIGAGQNAIPPSRQVQSQQNLLSQQNQSQIYNNYQPDYQNQQYQNDYNLNNQQQYDQRTNNYQEDQYQQQQQKQKDFDNPAYQQQLQQQEKQMNQQFQQKGIPQDYLPNQNIPPPQIYDQNVQERRSSQQQLQQQYNDQKNYQQQQGYQQPLSASQIDNQYYSSPDILNDKRMKKIYNPLIQKVSAVYEPRYGVNASWDKYDREQFRNWENKEQHYYNIVRSKNFILDQHADYSTGNHEYGTKKVLY